MTPNRIAVVLRTCEFGSVRASTRPYNLSKTDLIRACFRSLHASVILGHFPDWQFHIVDDSSSEELRQWFESFKDLRGARPIVHRFEKLGGDGSFEKALELSETLGLEDADALMLCEDDYFYSTDCFWHLRDFFDTYTGDYFLSPYHQHLWLTRIMQVRQSGTANAARWMTDVRDCVKGLPPRHLLMTSGHWWAQQFISTLTICARMGTIRRNWPTIWQSRIGSNDAHLSTCYQVDPCYTPLPGLASHFQEGCETPYFTDYMTEQAIRGLAKP
jgi:hypothetical protein